MSESFDQFLSRTDSPQKPLPTWVSALVFLSVFFILQMTYDACRGSDFEHFILGDLTVAPTAAVIDFLTPAVHVKALGNQLIAPGGGITVLKGCEGTEIMFMLMAAFAAVVMPWRRRLTGLGLGILLVFCINQVRLVTLFYVYRSEPSLFNLLHGTVAPIVLILCIALYALYWMGDSREIAQPNAPTTP
ncbi:MAG: archaeosortase/exosortase family protein [Dechloromonas sp.]|uniref:archaeosortase/exosortase family protein n=1 Tax=Dechloromonas sp. TaxID=1917218 RepID=UPI0027FEBB9F|nr:archaeosortase/exosortase family protein [Dechloromonas sp.]MBT9519296.1 archaeosortase/exosortase family protein [Dechloromonas sp.]